MKTFLYFVLAISLVTLACKSDNPQQANAPTQTNGMDTTITFSNTDPSKFPSGWSAEKGDWLIDSEDTNLVLKMTNNNGHNFNIAVLKSTYYQNIEIEARIKALRGDEDQGGGLVWRYMNSRNYYIVRANPLENNMRLYKVVNNSRKQMQSVATTVKTGEWFTLKVKAQGDRIECYLNDALVISETDDSFSTPGLVGFWSKADAVSLFDDLKISVLK
jgi:hypothetical protein